MSQEAALVQHILQSNEWRHAEPWGAPRRGHPEGTIGRHVAEQVLPFIDQHYRHLSDYWNLVALAYLHDIGKPLTLYEGGRLVGDSHSVISANIARTLGAPERLCLVILHNDRPYSYWRKLIGRRGNWSATKWTRDRQESFRREFGNPALDLNLLVMFHRADNAYRRPVNLIEHEDPVFWFENRLLAEGLLKALPVEGKDQRYLWRNINV